MAIADLMLGRRQIAIDSFGEAVGAVELTEDDANRAVSRAVEEIEREGIGVRQPVVYLVGKTHSAEYVAVLSDLALRVLSDGGDRALLYQALVSLDDCAAEGDAGAKRVFMAVVRASNDEDCVEFAHSWLRRPNA